ncbi:RNA-directed DNA polymerase, eukaryota [Tanacetum coccineum]
MLWDYLLLLINRWDGECVIMGDFNEVRSEQERYGSVFNVQSATAFNNFIFLASLIDLPLDGYAYTWVHKSTNKMSKLDRFLISEGLMASFPHLLALCLDNHLSDHRPILMRETNITTDLLRLDFFILGGSNEAIINDRSILLKELQDIISMESEEVAQKAKVRWAIEAVWDYGTNKSLGPDGFTFEFFRRYWKFLENDISVAVMDFFSSDGPFILNELLSWCKYKKLKAMVFKVDFEKAFDSIRWDYLDDVLKKFGFGDKWCGWINSCLNLAKRSVLVNGSLTPEFQFHKDTLFWEDIWVDEITLKQQYLRLYALELTKQITVAGKLNHSSLVWSYRYDPRGCIEEEHQCMLLSRISSIILPNMLDRWVWSLEASGEFLVKSARSLIDDSHLPKEDVRIRCVKVVPININVFAWRVRLDKLTTRLNLSLRGVEISSIMCPLCNSSVESASHLFFHAMWLVLFGGKFCDGGILKKI